jgi:hypothetical protein
MCLPLRSFLSRPTPAHQDALSPADTLLNLQISAALFFNSSRGGWVCLQLRASNEGLLRSRVARAKETTHLPRYSHVLGD